MKKLLSIAFAAILLQSCSTQNPNPNNNGNINQTYTQGPNVTDFDGNVYPSVINCNLTWISKNLDVSHYRNGDIIPQVTDSVQWKNLTTGAWCYYNNDPAMGAIYGKLYNWYAVTDPRGLAPQGWHVPSDAEWNKLVKCIDPSADTTCQGCSQSATAGGAMKESGTSHWTSPNTGATNSSGLSVLPCGLRDNVARFWSIKEYGTLWSSTQSDSIMSWARNTYYDYCTISRAPNLFKGMGFSVRLVKN
jgi:uncharacterized protein (TIGR02145 family)